MTFSIMCFIKMIKRGAHQEWRTDYWGVQGLGKELWGPAFCQFRRDRAYDYGRA
jgi:hypothetical protein